MLRKVTKLVPDSWLVFLYKKIPTSKRMKDWVMWYTNEKFLVAVLAIIKNEKGEVLLLDHSYRNQPLGIPSGWMEAEQPGRAMERELLEETGLQVRITKTLSVKYHDHPKRVDILLEGIDQGGDFQASSEVTNFGFYDPGDLPEGLTDVQHALIQTYT